MLFRSPIRETLARPRPETPGTTPVHLVLQVAEALRMLRDEGVGTAVRRHEANAAVVRQEIARLGLSLQCPSLRSFAPTVTAIALPEDVPPNVLRDGLKARGILAAAAMGRFESSAFRIGHMGDIRRADVDRTLLALAETLGAIRGGIDAALAPTARR